MRKRSPVVARKKPPQRHHHNPERWISSVTTPTVPSIQNGVCGNDLPWQPFFYNFQNNNEDGIGWALDDLDYAVPECAWLQSSDEESSVNLCDHDALVLGDAGEEGETVTSRTNKNIFAQGGGGGRRRLGQGRRHAQKETAIESSSDVTEAVKEEQDQVGADTPLEHLVLPGRALKGTMVPEIALLSSLRTLDLSHNQLSGNPTSTVEQLTNLEYLNLGWNQFDSLPFTAVVLNALPKLKEFRMSFNFMGGKLADILEDGFGIDTSGSTASPIQKHEALQVLDIAGNNFTGVPPQTLDLVVDKLQELNLGQNELTGSLPSVMARLPALKKLNLSFNVFEDTLSVAYLFGAPLEELDVSNLTISSIATEIGLMTSLKSLTMKDAHDLNYYDIEGPVVPTEMGLMTSLTRHDLALTYLGVETFPTAFLSMTNLLHLNLTDTNPGDQPLHKIQALSSLQTLDLSFTYMNDNCWTLDKLDPLGTGGMPFGGFNTAY